MNICPKDLKKLKEIFSPYFWTDSMGRGNDQWIFMELWEDDYKTYSPIRKHVYDSLPENYRRFRILKDSSDSLYKVQIMSKELGYPYLKFNETKGFVKINDLIDAFCLWLNINFNIKINR